MNDPLNINKLFDDIIEEEVVIEQQPKLQLKEKERLKVLHSLDKDNIDYVFDNLIEYKDELINDHIGKQYNQWTVLSFLGSDKHSIKYYECLCQCGTLRKATIPRIKNNPYCYNCRINKNDLIGKVFGKRKIIRFESLNKKEHALVECICGNISHCRLHQLMKGGSNQCKKCDIEERKIKKRAISVINEQYGNRIIISERFPKYIVSGKITYYVQCKCICGFESSIGYNRLKSGRNNTCRNCIYKSSKENTIKEKINQKFGQWTIIDYSSHKSVATCQCVCNNIQKHIYTKLFNNIYAKCKNCKKGRL